MIIFHWVDQFSWLWFSRETQLQDKLEVTLKLLTTWPELHFQEWWNQNSSGKAWEAQHSDKTGQVCCLSWILGKLSNSFSLQVRSISVHFSQQSKFTLILHVTWAWSEFPLDKHVLFYLCFFMYNSCISKEAIDITADFIAESCTSTKTKFCCCCWLNIIIQAFFKIF